MVWTERSPPPMVPPATKAWAHDDVDRVGGEAGGEGADEHAEALGVGLGQLVRRRRASVRRPARCRAWTRRAAARPARGRRRRRGATTPPSSGRATWVRTCDPAEGEQRRHRLEAAGVVVVAGDDHHRARPRPGRAGPGRRPARTRARARTSRTGRRRRGRGRRPRRRRSPAISASTARCSSARLAPRMSLPTCQSEVWSRPSRLDSPSNGSSGTTVVPGDVDGPVVPSVSDDRVAQAGNGNSTTTGTGSWGWLTIMVPGLMMVARWRCDAGSQPYSPRVASAESSRPTTRMARVGDHAPLDLAGGLLGADEDDAERATPLGDVEQDLLDGRGALAWRVLVELVEHDELQRLGRRPTPPCASNAWRSTTPTTNRLARSFRLWMSTTVTWLASRSTGWLLRRGPRRPG